MVRSARFRCIAQLCTAVTVLTWSSAALGKNAPSTDTLDAQRQKLQQTQSELSQSKQKHEKIKTNLDTLEHDFKSITRETESIAANLQEIERSLSALEEQLTILQASKKEKEFALKQRGGELSGMVGAMIRLGRAPQEAVMVMPGGVAGKIRASRALGLMSDALQHEIRTITQRIEEIQRLEADITSKQLALKKENVRLLERREALSLTMKEQQSLLEQLHAEDLEHQQRIVRLSRASQDLQSLVATLEKEREKQRLARLAAQQAEQERARKLAQAEKMQKSPAKTKYASIKEDDAPALNYGNVSLPAAGKITGRYGQKKGANNTLRGLEITTREAAVVTSPSSGEVLFTGPFMEYGKMVIIRASARHMVLVAGLERIQCRAGQRLNKGQPLGVMGSSAQGKKLYMELRDHGKPTDPMPWLSKGATLAQQ